MDISIITRSLRADELLTFLRNVQPLIESGDEIVAVVKNHNIDLSAFTNLRIFESDSNRFQARVLGIKMARNDGILLLDSDQYLNEYLIKEIKDVNSAVVMIPEVSDGGTVFSSLLDSQRGHFFKLSKIYGGSPLVPAVPRFYRKDLLMKALNEMEKHYFIDGLSHEDSILYYYVFKYLKNIYFAENPIINQNDSFSTTLRKSYLYGKFYSTAMQSPNIELEIKELIKKLNISMLVPFRKEIGFNPFVVVNFLRMIPYGLGKSHR